MTNHSMNPNALTTYALGDRGKMTLVASRDINSGEEVTISYTPFENSFMQNLTILKTQYYFDYNGNSVERPLIWSFQSRTLGKAINIRQLQPADSG